jgi:hypothetical protein
MQQVMSRLQSVILRFVFLQLFSLQLYSAMDKLQEAGSAIGQDEIGA